MLLNDLDAILIIKWEVPSCSIIYKTDSKILRERFNTKEQALDFALKKNIKIQEIIGKGWNEKNGIV